MDDYNIQPSPQVKQPEIHHAHFDHPPYAQQARFSYATPGDGNPVNGTVAHQDYLEPDLNWRDRRRCARIQGTILLRHVQVSHVC